MIFEMVTMISASVLLFHFQTISHPIPYIEKQHHEKRTGKIAKFLARIVPSVSKQVVLYVAIYALYIAASSVGVSHKFLKLCN